MIMRVSRKLHLTTKRNIASTRSIKKLLKTSRLKLSLPFGLHTNKPDKWMKQGLKELDLLSKKLGNQYPEGDLPNNLTLFKTLGGRVLLLKKSKLKAQQWLKECSNPFKNKWQKLPRKLKKRTNNLFPKIRRKRKTLVKNASSLVHCLD